MKTLRDRLNWAMNRDNPPITSADLVRACKLAGAKISSAAIAKWFTAPKPPEYIRPAFLFPVAERLRVDPKWLATGKGKWDDGLKGNSGLPYHRLALIQAYGTLPSEVRAPIRNLIEALSAAQSDRYAQWSKGQELFNKNRDAVHENIED